MFIEFTLLTNNYTNIEGRVIKRVDLQVEKIEMLYQKLNRVFDSGHLSTETNIEDRDLLKSREENLIDNSVQNVVSDGSNSKDELDLEDIYNMNKESEE